VTSGRIKYLDEIRKANGFLLGLIDRDTIKFLAKTQKTDKCCESYLVSLNTEVGKLKTYFKPFYPIEQAIISALDALVEQCTAQFLSPEQELGTELNTAAKRYNTLYAQYDWAYWQYIQKQADGKFLNSSVQFDKVYGELAKEMKKDYDYTWLS
jgi:hypothetical protein